MKQFVKNITLILLIFTADISCSSVYDIAANKLLQIRISNLGPTRITLESGKITDVFFYPEEAAKVVLHKSGAVFVVKQPDHDHVYLTIMGENGYTQDLRLKFVFKQPDPILLSNVHTTKQGNIVINVKGKRKK